MSIQVNLMKFLQDLQYKLEVTILEPLGENDIGSGDDFWGSVPEGKTISFEFF